MIEKIAYQDLPNCYRVSNELVELITTSDVGPRILYFGFVGQWNELVPSLNHGYSGHRLWHAPEAFPRSYIPDNNPIEFKQHNKFFSLTPPTEAETGIQKEMDISVNPEKNHVTVVHRLYNRGLWPVEIAPWAISAMATGGKAIFPLPPRKPADKTNLLPTTLLAIWEYSDLSDPRMKLGRRFIILGQDINASEPLKIGVMDTDNWAAYWNKGHLFVKTFEYQKGATYPDLGCSAEAYSSNRNLELETVAPLKLLQPNESSQHVENWYLFRDVPEPFNDTDIEKNIVPLIPV
ncbi:MAG: hypothetical protein ACLPVI_00770 [Dehalococcoidales bacterium]